MFRSKGLWHEGDGRHAKLRLTLTPGVALDTEPLEAGKMSSCEKEFLMFRIPSQGPGTMKHAKINLFEEREIGGTDETERHESGGA